MLITILGKRWNFRRQHKLTLDGRKVDGKCDPPTMPRKEIVIDERLTGERELDVIVHEMLHAAGWHLDHGYVTEFASDVARVLTKLGYQRT